MSYRTITLISIIVLILAFPFWLYIPCLVLATLYFPFFYESILLGFLIDVLYGIHIRSGVSFMFPFAITFSLLVIVLLSTRKYLRVTNV